MDVYDEVDRRENDAGEWSGTSCEEQGPSELRSEAGQGRVSPCHPPAGQLPPYPPGAGAHLALATSHSGCLPSHAPPLPCITPSWPQPDSNPNSGSGLVGPALLCCQWAGLTRPGPESWRPRHCPRGPGGLCSVLLHSSLRAHSQWVICSLPFPHSVASYPKS